jgi:uncharacterized RmlC-like cupin family protein
MADEIRIIPPEGLQEAPPTPGMTRRTAVAGDTVWLGEVRTEPGAMSAWHHHGEHTTYGYIIEGSVRVEFGSGGDKNLEGSAGDFFVVPPHTIHREGNPGSDEQILAVVRFGEGPAVINVDGPET